jgi:transcription antitermination factor NusG
MAAVEQKGTPVPDDTIALLKREMRGEEVREVSHGLKRGESVEIAEGPMRGLTGIVENVTSGDERVVILLEFLGRQSMVKVPMTSVISERSPRESLYK